MSPVLWPLTESQRLAVAAAGEKADVLRQQARAAMGELQRVVNVVLKEQCEAQNVAPERVTGSVTEIDGQVSLSVTIEDAPAKDPA